MPVKDTIEYSDFEKLDIRVGKIIAASAPEWSRKLLEFKVDFGAEIGERTILSGVKTWYQPDDFLNNSYLFVVNLAPRKMGESESQGMMLMADEADQPVPIPVPAEIELGSVIR